MPQRLSRVGLVTRVTESDDLLDEALAMARSIIEAPRSRSKPQSAICDQ
jgi:enoyl-CoA hydratase/carnithine racemase